MSETNFPKHGFGQVGLKNGSWDNCRSCAYVQLIASKSYLREFSSTQPFLLRTSISNSFLLPGGRWHHYEHVHIKLKSKELSAPKPFRLITLLPCCGKSIDTQSRLFPEETRLMVEVINAYINKQPIAANPIYLIGNLSSLQKLELFYCRRMGCLCFAERVYVPKAAKLRQRYELDNRLPISSCFGSLAMWLLLKLA